MSVFDSPFNQVFHNPFGSPFNGDASSGTIWTPAKWFLASEQGIWLDSSDMSTLFQDAAGTTPVTAVGQPVGLMLDKRLGLVRGANNSLIASYKKDADGTSFAYLLNANASNAGKFFEVELEFVSPPTGSGVLQFLTGGTTYYFGAVGAGRWRCVLMGGTGDLRIGGTTTDRLDTINISVRELPGNHAFQANTSNKPVLRQSGGLYYLQFDGVDDWLSTRNIDFTATHEMTVVVGVQSPKTSQGMLLELGTSYDSTFPSFVTFVPNTADGKIFAAYHDTAGYGSYSTAAGIAINANVIAYSFDTAATTVSGKYPRFHLNGVNGMPTDTSPVAAGAAFINAPLYIGRRAGTSTPFLGNLYQLVVRGAATADLAPIEAFTADKAGVTL
jgi:hypothetical protein